MQRILRRLTYANVTSTLALFLALGGTAYAANGGTFVLGRANSASATTTLSNSGDSPVLALNAKSGRSPISTNSNKLVRNLNADLLDGLDSTKFALTSGKTCLIFGHALTGEAQATCPSGTQLTGGGAFAAGADNVLWFSGPDGTVARQWDADATPANEEIFAVAVCYNPKGSVPGAQPAATIASLRNYAMLHKAH